MVKYCKLDENAFPPTRKYPEDAGIDIYSLYDEVIPPNEFRVVRTGINIEIPKRCVGLLFPKGKHNYLIGSGVIDEGFQGEYLVKIFNTGTDSLVIRSGDAICQLILLLTACVRGEIEEGTFEELYPEISNRGSTGGIFDC